MVYYSLAKGDDTYYVLDGSGSSIRLYYDGVGRSMFGPNDSTGIYTPTNVEENPFDSGFLVLVYRNDKPEWNNSSFFNYNNFGFEFDTLGKYTGSDLKTVNNHTFPRPGIEYEPVFGLDLNDDGNIATGANPPNFLNISTNQHHIDDGHVSDGIILKRDSVTIDPNSNGGLNATQVEKNGDHYELLLEHKNVKYDVWKFDASGNFISNVKAKLWQDELKFGIDLNGDGDTGLVTIEDKGSVYLKHGDNTYNGTPQYYFVNGSDDPIGLTRGNTPVRTDASNGWNATQVEESIGGGYEVFWSHSISGKYSVWKVDAAGNFEGYVSASMVEHELTFQTDLDGDGHIGIHALEDNGDYSLGAGGNQYYIIDKISGSSVGLTRGNTPVRTDASNGWNATQVEESIGGGYEVFWSHSISGKYSVWKVDAAGNFEGYVSASMVEHELTFQTDLDGDGHIGIHALEDNGDYSLGAGGNQYYIIDKISGSSVGLTRGNTPVRTDASNGWNATQVEESIGGGYEVFWSHSISGKYSVWKVDAAGNFEGYVSASMVEHELTFQTDLDGDGHIGIHALEDNGDYSLGAGGNQYYIIDKISGSSVGLTRGNTPVRTDASNGWNATQVEESIGGGYEVFWSHSISGKYSVWKVDAAGNFEGYVSASMVEHELTFQTDLDGDGHIGIHALEDNGDYSLGAGGNQYYIIDKISGSSVGLTRGNTPVRTDASNGWNATQVEESIGGGYEVFWSHSISGKYSVWKVDAAGNFEGYVSASMVEHELTFQTDLDGDGHIGIHALEDNGDYSLGAGGNQYYIIDKISGSSVGLTRGNTPVRTDASNGWNATQVEESIGGGYEVFWSHSISGKYSVWKVDAAGNFEGYVSASMVEHELTFQTDLDGDGIGGGDDNIYGSIGDDTFDGGAGDDIINGRQGHDILIGSDGNDWISGDGGSGYAGNDILFGNAGNDDLRGRDGNDKIYGGNGNDILDGGEGNDTLDGGKGSNTITAGSGSDKIILRIGDGGNALSDADTITDFTDGSDDFGLTNGFSFGDLTIRQGSGDHANDTIIKYGSEYLAILRNIDVSLLTEADFEDVDIA